MKNQYLLSGSFAYDTILLFNGKLDDQILPHALSRLNVAFSINSKKTEFGGTGGNIAYSASLIGDNPMIIGLLGKNDCQKYLTHLKNNNISTNTLTLIDDFDSPGAFILTDNQNNQITSFYSGSMEKKISIPDITPKIWHLAPENPMNTARLAKEALKLNKEYFFDPGQCMPLFLNNITDNIMTLKEIIDNAKGIFVNDYEFELLESKFKFQNIFNFLKQDQFLIKTLGSKGLQCFINESTINIPVYPAKKIVDPTGCGDAFRAGFLHGYSRDFNLEQCLKTGAIMGSQAIEYSGGQNHKITQQELYQNLDLFNKNNKKLKIN